MIHIADWRRARNGPMRPVYEFGPGKQAARPSPRTPAEKSVLHRRRKLALSGGIAAQVRMAASA